ncbi:MAG TPA: ABC transporter substrate-binding protein [Acetobacteraceae bacterium]|jgi:branched-chain amino acid transport system substrate-binding protein|nr:ABC transporter substrate-binding protein [Acetobacteraceae bacterium]
MTTEIARRAAIAGGLVGAALIRRARAQTRKPVRIAVINDQTGIYSDLGGVGSIVAAKLAAQDFGPTVLGRSIEILSGDHQNKPDIGVALLREWYSSGVEAAADFANSAISLAANPLAVQYDKIALHCGSTSSAISGTGCSPNGIHWAQDTYADSTALFEGLLKSGPKSCYFITVDYAFGLALEADSIRAVKKFGGTVVGAVKHPLGDSDYGSYLASAASSGAQVVVIASAGGDTITCVKQAAEFGVTQRQQVVTPILYLTDVHALGLKAAHGLEFVQSWYWDLTDASRVWAKRFEAQMKRKPTDLQASVYSSTLHYLKSAQKAGTTDTKTVLAAMKAMPVSDMFTPNGHIQANNKMIFDVHLMRAKKPEESKYAWDYMEQIATIPGDQAFRDAAESGCPFVSKT